MAIVCQEASEYWEEIKNGALVLSFVVAILWGIGGFNRLGRDGEGRSELFP